MVGVVIKVDADREIFKVRRRFSSRWIEYDGHWTLREVIDDFMLNYCSIF